MRVASEPTGPRLGRLTVPGSRLPTALSVIRYDITLYIFEYMKHKRSSLLNSLDYFIIRLPTSTSFNCM